MKTYLHMFLCKFCALFCVKRCSQKTEMCFSAIFARRVQDRPGANLDRYYRMWLLLRFFLPFCLCNKQRPVLLFPQRWLLEWGTALPDPGRSGAARMAVGVGCESPFFLQMLPYRVKYNSTWVFGVFSVLFAWILCVKRAQSAVQSAGSLDAPLSLC